MPTDCRNALSSRGWPERDKLLTMKNILTEKGGQSLNLCPEESLED